MIRAITICSSFTAEPLQPFCDKILDGTNPGTRVRFAPYAQVLQELLSPESSLRQIDSAMNVLLLRASDLVGPIEEDSVDAAAKDVSDALFEYGQNSTVPILVVVTAEKSISLVRDFTHRLEQATAGIPVAQLVRSEVLADAYPVSHPYDDDALVVGHIPYTEEYFAAIALVICRHFWRLGREAIKVIAVDCDNTLWSGVCGEGGPSSLAITDEHLSLQRFLKQKAESGVLLSLCSKNVESDVVAVFRERDEMLLEWTDFISHKINWQPKSKNISAIADDLRLGRNSILFLDDNPVEVAEVQARLPEVLSLRLPVEEHGFGDFLGHCWALDNQQVTSADRLRAASYRDELRRKDHKDASASFRDFLEGLGLNVVIESATASDIPRISQMSMRTNQFNATTRRMSEADAAELLEGESNDVFVVRVSDRFGDYGTVGLVVVSGDTDAACISDFLLSCRVLGRGVEHKVIEFVGELLSGDQRPAPILNVAFNETEKNIPVRGFLEGLVARCGTTIPSGFSLEIDQLQGLWPPSDAGSAASSAKSSTNESKTRTTTRTADLTQFAWSLRSPAALVTAVDNDSRSRGDIDLPFVEPKMGSERVLADIWRRVLRIDKVGRTDRFVDLGGTSLDAVRVHSSILRRFGQDISLPELLNCPTVAHLANVVIASSPVESRVANARAIASRQRAAMQRVQDTRRCDGAIDG